MAARSFIMVNPINSWGVEITPYKDPEKRKEAVRKSVKKYRSKPENMEKEEEYRNSGRGRDVNTRAQRRWRWKHNRNVGDTRTEILLNVRDPNKYALELRRQVKAITPKPSQESSGKRLRKPVKIKQKPPKTGRKPENHAKPSKNLPKNKAKQGKNGKK